MDQITTAGFNPIWIIDIIAIIVMIVFVIRDTRKGFVRGIFGLLISVASIAVAFFCASMVSEITGGAFGLEEAITNSLSETFANWGLNFDISQGGIKEKLMEQSFFKTLPFLVDLVMEKIPAVETNQVTYLNEELSMVVGRFVTDLVVGIILFILCRLVLTLVEKILTTLIQHVKLFDALNTILGAVVGLMKGAIIVSIIVILLSTVPFFGNMLKMEETIFVYECFFVNNPIIKIMGIFV